MASIMKWYQPLYVQGVSNQKFIREDVLERIQAENRANHTAAISKHKLPSYART